MSDEKIIELYNQRNEIAIKETSQKYGGYCFSIANNILGNVQDTEECVNDAFLKAWNSIPPQRPRCLGAFLAKITRNLSLNRYKEKTREKRGGAEADIAFEEIDEFLSGTDDISGEMERKEFTELLNRFLYSLPERERNIFILRYFYMDSIAAIAKEHTLTESNVLIILSRTRKKLKDTLERAGYTV